MIAGTRYIILDVRNFFKNLPGKQIFVELGVDYLNDGGDKLFSNKEFIMSQVRGEPSPDFILDVGQSG